MKQELFKNSEEYYEFSDTFDIYQPEYTQQLLDDDALATSEAAFLEGYLADLS